MTTARRVMKARWSACCVLCGRLYLRLEPIGLIDLGEGREGWAHTRCVIKTQQPAA